MKFMGFNHFQLDSNDVEATKNFYEALGGKVIRTMTRERPEGWKMYHVALPGCVVEIQPPRFPDSKHGWNGWDHVAFTVENCEVAVRVVEENGGKCEKRPSSNKLGDTPIKNAVTYGIDGEKIELIEYQPSGENFRVLGLNHLQLNCEDVERAKNLYETTFGGKIVNYLYNRDGSVKGYMLEIYPGSVLEISTPRFPFTGDVSAWNTIALECDDINAGIETMEKCGFVKEVGPFKGIMGEDLIYNAVLIGSEGEHIELIQMRSE